MQGFPAPQGRGLRNPVLLIALAAALIAFVVQSGELGSADTTHRLQSTHSFWTSEPPVFPNEYPEFGIHGKDGSLQSWYGIGQSLLMLPSDIIGTWIERLPVFADYNGNDPSVRNIFVSYTVNIGVNVLTAFICMRFLGLLGFSMRQRAAGTLALLALTTHLHYTQNMMENNYICLLTLTGFTCWCEWVQTGRRKTLLLGACAFGLNLLTRLTTGMDLLAGILFLALALYLRGERSAQLWKRCRTFLATAVPAFVVFSLLDRLYQYHRFGSFFNTYVGVVAREARARNPNLPASYPFETPFHEGFFGALFSSEKSIFLFDPLLILMAILVIVAWNRFRPEVRAYVIACAALLLADICFYARYTVWNGNSAWGDRYVSTAAELAAFLGVPLLMRCWGALGRALKWAGAGIVAISAVVQAASTAFWLSLEIYQMRTLPGPVFVIGLRLKNIVAFSLGKMDAWGLTNAAMREDPWDYVHITSWNFLPFVLERGGEAPMWVVRVTLVFWLAVVAALAWVLLRLRRVLRGSEATTG